MAAGASISSSASAAPRGRGRAPARTLPPTQTTRAVRALLVLGAWGIGALPTALGWQKCVVATLLHRPCPGCGMTRAMQLLAAGHVQASLRMHPLAVPVLLAGSIFVASTVWTTFRTGSPVTVYASRVGRVAIGLLAVVYVAAVLLWILRWFGFFGGPVPT
jgi:hypothetical protein